MSHRRTTIACTGVADPVGISGCILGGEPLMRVVIWQSPAPSNGRFNDPLLLSDPVVVLTLPAYSMAIADNHRVVYETEIDADINAVWNAFTTNEGLNAWMAPLVEINLDIGGKMKVNYNEKARLAIQRRSRTQSCLLIQNACFLLRPRSSQRGFRSKDAARLRGPCSTSQNCHHLAPRSQLSALVTPTVSNPKGCEQYFLLPPTNSHSASSMRH